MSTWRLPWAWIFIACSLALQCQPVYADTLTTLLTRVLQGGYDVTFEQRFLRASDLFQRRQYDEAAELFRGLHADASDERDKELLRGYANASYYGARRNRDGLDFLCELSPGGGARAPDWFVHDAHAHIRAVAMRDGFASGEALALHYRVTCQQGAFSPIWIGVPLVKMEKLRAGVFVLDEGYSLDYSDEQLLGYVLRTYSGDPYADYARYFLHEFESVGDASLRALIDHRPARAADIDDDMPADGTAASLAQTPTEQLLAALLGDRTVADGAAYLREVMEALSAAGRYADLERIVRDTPLAITAAVFAEPGTRYHDILRELRARTFAAANLGHADAARVAAIAARENCGNVADCIFYVATVPGSRHAQRSVESFLTAGGDTPGLAPADLAAFREAIDSGRITDLAIAHLVEWLESRARAAEVANAVGRELAACGCPDREFIETRPYDDRYAGIYRSVLASEYDRQIVDGPQDREHWRRLAELVADPKARRYTEQIVSRSHDVDTALIERVAALLVADDPDGLLDYAIDVRGHCNNPHPSGRASTVCDGYPKASSAVFRLIANEYPELIAGEKALFLLAQVERTRLGGGRAEFEEFIAAYPNSPLIDDAHLELTLLMGAGSDDRGFVDRLKSIASTYAEHNAADNALYALAEHYKERGDLLNAARYYGKVAAGYAASRLGRKALPHSVKMRRAWKGLASRKRLQGVALYGTYLESLAADADVVSDLPLQNYDHLRQFSGTPIEDEHDIFAAFADTAIGETVDLVFSRLEWNEATEEEVESTIRARARIGQIEWFDIARVAADDHLKLRSRPDWRSNPPLGLIAPDQTCVRYAGDERTLSSGAVWFKVRARTTTSASTTGWVNATFLKDAPGCADR